LAPGISQHGGSPTKVGEYWAAGLPVVVTPGIGDTEEIIRRERVGVVVSEFSGEAYDHALSELLNLLEDPYLPGRCRAAAEKHYSLETACERLQELYSALIGDRLNERDREVARRRGATARRAGRGSKDKEV
jgi:glycosyltransferase involved in cell wall biosynthesis